MGKGTEAIAGRNGCEAGCETYVVDSGAAQDRSGPARQMGAGQGATGKEGRLGSGRAALVAAKHKVPRLRSVIHKPDDGTTLGMTGLPANT